MAGSRAVAALRSAALAAQRRFRPFGGTSGTEGPADSGHSPMLAWSSWSTTCGWTASIRY